MAMTGSVRQVAGTLAHDWPRLLWCLRPWSRAGWVRMRNRQDVLSSGPDGMGLRCEWRDTRPLHLGNLFPLAGTMLMNRALDAYPLRFADCPASGGEPSVSFLIGHRGEERLASLLAVLSAIAGQRDVGVEAVVVEQDVRDGIGRLLPSWVRYVFDPVAEAAPYNRARAFNRAAAAARGRLLVLHDGDLLIPADYAAAHVRSLDAGYDVVSLKRFIFCLPADASRKAAAERRSAPRGLRVERVLQNATGGGSVAIARDAFSRIGGMDEDFEGWGGEDVEFWGRAKTLRTNEYGFLPLLHLWHAPAPKKLSGDRNNVLMNERCARPAAERIARLRSACRDRRPGGQAA